MAEVRELNYGAESAKPVINGDVAALINYLDVYMLNLAAGSSAHLQKFEDQEVSWAEKNWNIFKSRYSTIQAQPNPYMPNSDEIICEIPSPPKLTLPENTLLIQMLRFLARLRMQLRNGQSKAKPYGFVLEEHESVYSPSFIKFDQYIAMAKASIEPGGSPFFAEVDTQSALENEPGYPGETPNN